MAKVNAPLLSLGGSGTIGGSMTFSKWKGRPYVRQRVDPSNPNTASQQETRSVFAWSSGVWKVAGTLLRAPWERYAQGLVLSGRNAFQGQNTKAMRGETDLALMIFSPGAKGGLPPVDITLTPGSEQIQVDFTNPSAPDGWTLVSAIACAIRDQDPQTEVLYDTVEDEDDTTQSQVTLTGLTASELYQVGAWLEWTKPDGSTAYGASLIDSATPTA